jgi:hypothetical protein
MRSLRDMGHRYQQGPAVSIVRTDTCSCSPLTSGGDPAGGSLAKCRRRGKPGPPGQKM